MTVRANKPAFNVREKLKELERPIGLKGSELMRAETAQEARDLVSAGRKNLVINGEFAVSQRGTTFTYSGTNQDHTVYNSDRFTTQTFGGSFPSGNYLQITQSSDVPTISQAGTRFKNSQKIEVLQDISFGSGPNAVWTRHTVEGQNSANLGLGTSEASDFTVSFWVKSTKTGTITVNLKSSDSNLSYTTAADISSADSWQKIVKTIPGPTSGTFNTDSTAGLQLIITWSINSGWIATSTLDTWNSGNFSGSTTQSKMLLADGDIIYLTGVQIEKGKVATEFEHRSYGEELALCLRYFWIVPNARWLMGYKRHDSLIFFQLDTPVPMRTSPTPTITSVGVLSNHQGGLGGAVQTTGISVFEYRPDSGRGTLQISSTYSGTHTTIPSWEAGTIEFDAEL